MTAVSPATSRYFVCLVGMVAFIAEAAATRRTAADLEEAIALKETKGCRV